MSNACIFCKIAKGEIPSFKVHEDEHTLAFLDIQPLAEGHTLVVPKTHAVLIQDLPAADNAALWGAVQQVAAKLQKTTGAPATTVAVNNGRAAGQEVPHVHVHVVPRREGDGGGPIHAIFGKRPDLSKDAMAKLAERLRGA
ncbi:MAG TPA: HIT domain-containing protein [Candidatus Thermoplasmatota archaeon]|nr:HIT domain-containing protein [Candidatus Thermoplasmatota archaeon]